LNGYKLPLVTSQLSGQYLAFNPLTMMVTKLWRMQEKRTMWTWN